MLAVDVDLVGVDNDPDDALSFLVMAANLESISTRLRIQARPCEAPGCTHPVRTFTGYRGSGPDDDTYDYGPGLDITIQGELTDYSVEIIPAGVACVLTLGTACAVIEDEARVRLRTGMRNVASTVGRIATALPREVRVNRFSGEPDGDDSPGNDIAQAVLLRATYDDVNPLPIEDQPPMFDDAAVREAWVSRVAGNARMDLAYTYISLDGSTGDPVPLVNPDGSESSGLSRLLSQGGHVVEVGLEVEAIREDCGPDPRVSIGGDCVYNPEAPICEVCRGCLGSVSSLCDFSGPAIRVPISPTTPIPSEWITLESTPEVASLVDTMYGTAWQIRGIYANVLDRLLPQYRYYTDIRYCAGGDPSSAECPTSAGEDRVVVRFSADGDLDGTPDAFDGCPEDASVGGGAPDVDHDGHADACDLCPLHAGPNRDSDGDGAADECDCDVDGDGCNQWEIGHRIDPPEGWIPPPGWVDTAPLDHCTFGEHQQVWDQDPRSPDDGSDRDGDLRTPDCDGDDDGDTVWDDGAHDGIDVYTPCEGDTVSCDDNCVDVADPTQADRNTDGLGDVCDPICNASSPAWRCEGPSGIFGTMWGAGIPEGLIPHGIDVPCPNCLVGLACASFVPGGFSQWPGIQGCVPGPATIRAFGARFQLDDIVKLAGLPAGTRLASLAVASDLDGDGTSEILLGIPSTSGYGGAVVALGSKDHRVLWRTMGANWGGSSFGASLALLDGYVFVGAPGASGGGSVVVLDLHTGQPLGGIGAPMKGDLGFGATLALDEEFLYVGAPFSSGGRGRIHALGLYESYEATYEGPISYGYLGSGPMATVDRGTTRHLIVGSASAQQGAGMVVRFDRDLQKILDVHFGQPGEQFGAALAMYPARSVDGRWEGFVGAPGAEGGRGRLYAITGAMEWQTTDLVGAEPNEHVAAALLLGDLGELYVGATGPVALGETWPGVWIQTDGWSAPQ